MADFLVILYILRMLPRVEPRVTVEKRFCLSVPKELYILVAAEVFFVFGGAVGSQFVLIYYILQRLQGTFFTVTAVEAVVSLAIITTVGITLKKKPETVKAAHYGIYFMIAYAVFMSWAPSVWVVLLAYFLQSIGHSLWFPRHRALLMRSVPEERRGEILGTLSSLNKLVCIIAPVFASVIASKIYVLAPFVVQLCTLGVVFFLYHQIGRIRQ
jgi:MFS family permease